MSASASSAIPATVSGASAARLQPMPRLSNDRQRKHAESVAVCGAHASPCTPTPWMKSTGGPSPQTR